jgi:hypothetical protein
MTVWELGLLLGVCDATQVAFKRCRAVVDPRTFPAGSSLFAKF